VLHINLFCAFILRASVSFLKSLIFVDDIGLEKDIIRKPGGTVVFKNDGLVILIIIYFFNLFLIIQYVIICIFILIIHCIYVLGKNGFIFIFTVIHKPTGNIAEFYLLIND
jgi:hypothetical protein